MDKRVYYSDAEIVDNYETFRFGSSGGTYVDTIERETVLTLLRATPRSARVLDLPIGTGRMARAIQQAGFSNIEGADWSDAMLERAALACTPAVPVSKQDAARTTFPSERFDVVLSFRFLFHYADIRPFLHEFRRILRPGGSLIFDVLRWSPRAWFPALQVPLGGATHTLRPDVVRSTLDELGFEVVGCEPILIVPSQLYRYVPAPLLRPLVRAEKSLHPSLRTKLVFHARKRRERSFRERRMSGSTGPSARSDSKRRAAGPRRTGARPVRITADDYGLAPSVNAAIEGLANERRITAVSVMVHRTAALDSVRSLAHLPVRTGIHLVFVEEAPLLDLRRDFDRALPASWRALLAELVARPSLAGRLADEARAQIERYKSLGLRLDFINSHQHAHLLPPLWRALTPLFAEYAHAGIRIASRGWMEPSEQGMLHAASRWDERYWPPYNVERLFPLGVRRAGRGDLRAVARAVNRFAESDLAHLVQGEIIMHPGSETPELRARYAHWRYHWDEEAARISSGDIDRVLAEAGLERDRPE